MRCRSERVSLVELNNTSFYDVLHIIVDATKSGGAFGMLAFAPELKLYQTTYQEPLEWVPREE